MMLDTKNARPARRDGLPGQRQSSSLVRVGELFRDAVRLNAAGVILVHNHPSGDPTPSPDDLHLTAEALAAGRLLDIDLLDHLVIGHDAYVSLRDRGVAFDRPAAAAAARPPDARPRRATGYTAGAARPTGVYCAARRADPARARDVPRRPARDPHATRRPTARRTCPPPCSTASSASSPATSGSTSGPPTRWSTSATAGSSSASRRSSRSTPRRSGSWRSARRPSGWSAGRRPTSSRSGRCATASSATST